MGWLFTQGQTRKQLIERLTTGRHHENDKAKITCLKHCARGNVLWTVWETRYKEDGRTERFIGCDLMRPQRDYGWGYKDMDESMHPYYYTCPVAYLEMVPKVACEEWRKIIYERHKRAQVQRDIIREAQIGDEIQLITGHTVRLKSKKPLCGYCGGILYKFKASQVKVREAEKTT